MSANRFLSIVEVLVAHQVRFIVVGGVAAVLQRVPVNTLDFDIVHDRTADNLDRLLAALTQLGTVYRDDPRNLKPQRFHLEGPRMQLLRTAAGLDFDVLGSIEEGLQYDNLLPDSEWVEVAGHSIRVLTLEKLIDIKRKLKRPKDQFMLLQLEATLDERNRSAANAVDDADER